MIKWKKYIDGKARSLVDYAALKERGRRETYKHCLSVQGLKRLCNNKRKVVKCLFVCKDVMIKAIT